MKTTKRRSGTSARTVKNSTVKLTLVKVKVKSKNKRTQLIRDLDKVCSNFTKNRANGVCELCGKAGTASHHHFSKKAFPNLRFNLDNLIWLCFYCHMIRIHRQGQYELARELLIKRLGEGGFLDLKNTAYIKYSETQKPLSTAYLSDLYIELTTPSI
jgi:Bacteriophage Lambda NinG protein